MKLVARETYRGDGAARRTAREAALWLARIELGTADLDAFEQWRSSDARNAIALARIVGASEAAVADADHATAGSGMSRRGALRFAGGCAAVAALTGGGLATRAYAWSSANSAVGECRTVILPDGSGARLNTASTLSWRFSDRERTLWIERGEVALDLCPGAASTLHAPTETVSLSPGRFNARLRGETLDLLVLRGEVAAPLPDRAGAGGVTIAKAGQGVLMVAGAPVVRAASPDQVAAVLAWQKGEILFQHETLGSAVEEYNRHLDQKIIIVDRDLANIMVGGRFTSNDPTAFLRALSVGLGIQVSRSETGYLLTH